VSEVKTAPKQARMRTPPGVEVGGVKILRVHTDILVGPKALYPSGYAEHGKDGWSVVIDDDLRCVWVGREGHWTRIGWDNVRYISFHKPAEDTAP
jgi:hypothetical protein